MKKIFQNDKGIAIVVVIMMVSIMIGITLQLNISSRSEIYEAANLSDSIRLGYVAKSGFYMGKAVLVEDVNNFDSLNEDWGKVEILSKGSGVLFDEGHFSLKIQDEAGKIQLNKLVMGNEYNEAIKGLMIRFLNNPEFGLDEQQVSDIVDAIKDWIDEDDEVTGFGAENAYYKGMENPYSCKNKPLDCVDELLMIKSITKSLYYGTKEAPGIAEYLTVYGDGKININTAPTMVLRALNDEITGEMLSDMDEFRKDEENEISKPSWYKNIPGMTGITIDSELVSIKTNTFTITSASYLGNMSRKLVGVIQRSDHNKKVKILSWKIN